jgi:DNA-directed RNA polymerase specialized sigma24 family protein
VPDDARGIDVLELLQAVGRRDAEATERLFSLLKAKIESRARREIYQPHRLFDEEDVVMIVFASLCSSLTLGNAKQPESVPHLERRLAVMTRRVVIDLQRREATLRRGGRETFCHDVDVNDISDRSGESLNQVDVQDELAILMDSLNKVELTELLKARLAGWDCQELAAMFDCSVRTIERRISDLRRAYTRHQFRRS